jgi:hypothetical protein
VDHLRPGRRLTVVGGGRRCSGGLAPRAVEDSLRPRRSMGVSGRPPNFTVRTHACGLSICRRRDGHAKWTQHVGSDRYGIAAKWLGTNRL